MTIKIVKNRKISITEHEYKALITVLDMLGELQADIGHSNTIQSCDTCEIIEMQELDRVKGILSMFTDCTERMVEII